MTFSHQSVVQNGTAQGALISQPRSARRTRAIQPRVFALATIAVLIVLVLAAVVFRPEILSGSKSQPEKSAIDAWQPGELKSHPEIQIIPQNGGDTLLGTLRLACGAGDALACSDLGLRFEKGNGVRRSDVSAAWYYRRALDIDPDDALSKIHLRALEGSS